MSQPRIYDFGIIKGTVKELAKTYNLDCQVMKGRLQRYNAGKIGLDKVLVSGRVKNYKYGTAEFHALEDMPDGRPENLAKIKVGKFDNI